MKERPDIEKLRIMVDGLPRKERTVVVREEMSMISDENQARILDHLRGGETHVDPQRFAGGNLVDRISGAIQHPHFENLRSLFMIDSAGPHDLVLEHRPIDAHPLFFEMLPEGADHLLARPVHLDATLLQKEKLVDKSRNRRQRMRRDDDCFSLR